MKKTSIAMLLVALVPTLVIAASIATTTVVPTLADTDRIPIGRPSGTTAYTTTRPQLLAEFRNYTAADRVRHPARNAAWKFGNVSTSRMTATYVSAPIALITTATFGSANMTNGNITTANIGTANATSVVMPGAGDNRMTLAVQSQISSSRTIVFGNHGLYVDGVQVVTW